MGALLQDVGYARLWTRRRVVNALALGVLVANVLTATSDAQTANLNQLRAAAEQNDATAQYRLGLAYQDGDIGITPDAREACRWFGRSAESGYAAAQNALGACYATGEGISRDAAKAVMWFRKAADQGLSAGQVNLGRAYRWGRGVDRDYDAALQWFKHAAAGGS